MEGRGAKEHCVGLAGQRQRLCRQGVAVAGEARETGFGLDKVQVQRHRVQRLGCGRDDLRARLRE